MPPPKASKLARSKNAANALRAQHPEKPKPVEEALQPLDPELLDPEMLEFCKKKKVQPVTVEDYDSDDDADDAPPGKSAPEPIIEPDAPESAHEAAIREFSERLQEAQRLAAAASAGTRKRSRYTGNSPSTIYRRKKARQALAKKGYCIDPFLVPVQLLVQARGQRARNENEKRAQQTSVVFEEEEESDQEVEVVEVEAAKAVAYEEEESEEEDEGKGRHEDKRYERREEEESDDECANGHIARDGEEDDEDDEDELEFEDEVARAARDEAATVAEKARLRAIVDDMLQDLRNNCLPDSGDTMYSGQHALAILHDAPAVRRARARLTVKSKDKKIDVFLRARITGMLGLLNLFFDDKVKCTFTQASELVSRMQGSGVVNHSRNLRRWTLTFIRTGNLPLHRLNLPSSVLLDEDISRPIRECVALAAKKRHFKAEDVVKIVAGAEIQAVFGKKGIHKPSISVRTAQRWLNTMGYEYGRRKRGMYFDGHEREDVVAYRNAFVARWREYEKRFQLFNNDGDALPPPQGFRLPNGDCRFRLYLITHDESIFYQNDRPVRDWHSKRKSGAPTPKGEGQTVMVSDFLVPEWGRLVYEDEAEKYTDEARVFLRPGKERDGYFTHDDLIRQVEHAIDIFETRTMGHAQGLFMFDNAPSHMKRAPDALSARYMVKRPSKDWTHKGCGVRMRDGVMLDGTVQPFYWPENHLTHAGCFKGMEQIIRERGLWPARGKLKAQCDGFKCPPGRTDCCCRRVLFCQPDFIAQKPALQEFIEARNHLCDFYPKYHCELNFIEQYWGAAKLRYRALPRCANLDEMQRNVVECLDDVSPLSIMRYANRSARFIDAYGKGLDGAEAIWANRKYHGHRTLPPDMIAGIKKAVAEYRKDW